MNELQENKQERKKEKKEKKDPHSFVASEAID